MKKILLLFLSLITIVLNGHTNDISSLSHLFLLDAGILDLDGDNYADKVSIQIIIPDSPTAQEIATASDIAARANLESLNVDFFLVKKESQAKNQNLKSNLILIGSNLEWTKELIKSGKIHPSNFSDQQGLVATFSHKNRTGIVLLAGSEKALLETGRAFFLRWPYLWEIWGRKEGHTYQSLEKDLIRFLNHAGIAFSKITIKTALYEFPPLKSAHDSIKRLRFNRGEINDLKIQSSY